MKHVERLEDADEQRYAGQTVHVEGTVRIALHLVVGSVGDAAKQRPRVFVPDLPAPDDVEEGFERGRAQPLPLLAVGQVGRVARQMPGCGIRAETAGDGNLS
jgi:hypothetical protein